MQHYFDLAKKLLTVHNTGMLKCIRIRNGICTVSNSKLSYITFIEDFIHLDVCVDAKKFMAACEGAGYEAKIKQTNEFVTFSKGSFKAKISLVKDPYPEFVVRGDNVSLDVTAFNALKKLQPFISTDVSRLWSCGVMFDTKHAYATNNVVAARTRLSTPRKFTLPAFTLTELLRASVEVVRISMNDNAVRFELSNGVALQSSIMNMPWPDIESIIDTAVCDAPPVPVNMKKGIESLVPLCDNMSIPRINLDENGMATADGNSQAAFSGHSFPKSSFHATPLLEVLKVATHLDVSTYPKPCYFKGPIIDGVIMGLR